MANPYYTVHQIDAHTWHIEDYFHDYMYVVEGGSQAAVIDTGMGLPGLKAAVQSVTDRPLIVLNTHGHLDHTGANGEFDEVYINLTDEALMHKHSSEAYRKVSIPAFMEETGTKLPADVTDRLIHLPDFPKVHPLTDGQIIDLGGRFLKVIAVPGHTKDSLVFLDEAGGMLFSGDMMCTMGIMLNFEESTDVSTFIASIEKLKQETQDKVENIYPGHHVIPISTEYYDKYIACGHKLLKDSTGSVVEHGTFGDFYRFHDADISLTFVESTRK